MLDVNAFVANLAQLLKQILGEGIVYHNRLEPDLWPVKCDADQLETVILNLVLNARDAMSGGGTLTVATENHPARGSGEGSVMLSIVDTGSGMSAEVLKYAFEPFFTTKDVGHGTGLGLSQAHGFMRQSGGEVRIDSTEGKGTAVHLLFPRYTGDLAPAGPVRHAPAPAATPTRAARILLVEDDELVRKHTAGVLSELGHEVIEAGSGKQALELLAVNPGIQLIFTDVGLAGGMSGPTLGRLAREISPATKILYTTGYAHERVAAEGVRPGDLLISKPFSFEELAHKVDGLLQEEASPGSVLVVEDEPIIRMNLALGRGDLGYRIVEAGSVAEAEAQISGLNGGIAAVVVDIGLPDGRGDDLVQKLRRTRGGIPAIITTGYEDDALRRKFAGDTYTALVGKPCDPADVAGTLLKMGVVGVRKAF